MYGDSPGCANAAALVGSGAFAVAGCAACPGGTTIAWVGAAVGAALVGSPGAGALVGVAGVPHAVTSIASNVIATSNRNSVFIFFFSPSSTGISIRLVPIVNAQQELQ